MARSALQRDLDRVGLEDRATLNPLKQLSLPRLTNE